MESYIASMRKLVGKRPMFVATAGGIIVNDDGEVLLQRRGKRERKFLGPAGWGNGDW